jgi:hypothetical protein
MDSLLLANLMHIMGVAQQVTTARRGLMAGSMDSLLSIDVLTPQAPVPDLLPVLPAHAPQATAVLPEAILALPEANLDRKDSFFEASAALPDTSVAVEDLPELTPVLVGPTLPPFDFDPANLYPDPDEFGSSSGRVLTPITPPGFWILDSTTRLQPDLVTPCSLAASPIPFHDEDRPSSSSGPNPKP